MKGRKPDAPGLQDLKGNSGRRKTKAEKQLADATRLAELLATAPGAEQDPLAPPAFLDQRSAPALAVWKEYAPRLHGLNMLDAVYRHTFALFCVYMGEFVTANEDILAKGYSVMVKTISGDKMPRENPSVSRRAEATKYILQLSENFGFTPLDQYKLLKEMGSVLPPGSRPGDLFGGRGTGGQAPAADQDAVGVMDAFDSAPPTAKPN